MKKVLILLLIFCSTLIYGCDKTTTTQTTVTTTTKPTTTTENKLELLKEKNPNNMVFYELFVRSSFDSNGDGIGDFKGITENINYFIDLGIEAIWLMPINESNSYHGYDIVDYMSVEQDYGTLEEFKEMLDVYNSNGIRIFMDFVINHTSDQHEWFKKAVANDPKYRNYYVWNNNNAYETFVGGMKDLNLKNEDVIKDIIEIGNYYIDLGVSGFRLDAVKHFFQPAENQIAGCSAPLMNYLLVNRLRNEFRKKNPDVFLISEVLDVNAVSNVYFKGSDSVFNFDLKDNIVKRVSGSDSTNYAPVAYRIFNDIRKINPNFIDSVIFDNHDLDRLASLLGDDKNKDKRLKLACDMLLSLPGNPFIYYGSELGLEGSRAEGENLNGYGIVYDEYRRLPLKLGNEYQTSWINTTKYNVKVNSYEVQKLDSNSLYNHYVNMINIRKNNIALKYGNDFKKTNLSLSGTSSFIRTFNDEELGLSQNVVVIHNFDTKEIDITSYGFTNLIYGSNQSNLNKISPLSTVIIELDNNKVKEYAK